MLPVYRTKKELGKKFNLSNVQKKSVKKNEDNVILEQESTSNEFLPYKNLHKISTDFRESMVPIKDYTFPFIDMLEHDIDDIDVEVCNVNICIYRINTSGIKPFIEYLLYKYPCNDTNDTSNLLTFPHFTYKKNNTTLKKKSDKQVKILFEDNATYKGYTFDDNIYTLFYNLYYDSNINICKMTLDDVWWWATPYEIFNYQKILYFDIHNSVKHVFDKNPDMMYLCDSDHNVLETPIIAYNGSHHKTTSFMAVFGIRKSSPYAPMGPYYYFSTFKSACRFAAYSFSLGHEETNEGDILTTNKHGKHTKGGLVRFAIFVGKMKVFMLTDKDDTSEISIEKAKQFPLIKKTLSLRDTAGNWAHEYNSTYVAEYEFNDKTGEKLVRTPFWTIKYYEQQTPLAYYYIDSNSAPESYDVDYDKYRIE